MSKTESNIHIDDDQLEEYREAFTLFDEDGDEVISTDEIKHVLRTLGKILTEAEIEDLIKDVDTDNSGTIDFDEFAIMVSTRVKDDISENNLREAFAVFDRQGVGSINFDNIKSVMLILGETIKSDDDVLQMVKEVDSDGDGRITFQDIVNLMKP